MTQSNDVSNDTGQVTRQSVHWYHPARCSICLRLIWFQIIILSELVEAPEPHQQWILCKQCYQALLAELRRSTIRSPLRLRIAIGLVAAERSPVAHTSTTRTQTLNSQTSSGEQQAFQREFAWFTWALILFTLLHAVIFVILFTVR
jgi:hypothetical protein